MSDIGKIATGSLNNPPTNPQTPATQFQKGLFPFTAFTSDDPNVTNPPKLTLKSPWQLVVGAVTAFLTMLGISAFIQTLLGAADAPTARGTLGAAPLPQSAAGAGQWKWKTAVSGVTLSLDAGGTWEYLVLVRQDSTGYVWWVDIVSSVAAGGTGISSPGAGFSAGAQVWEILDAKGFDKSSPIHARDDGSFVITTETGHPYQVLTHEQAEALYQQELAKVRAAGRPDSEARRVNHDALYDEVAAYVAAHPECLAPEPQPDPVKIDPEMQLHAEIMASLVEQAKATPKWQARLKVLRG